ncbi:MAG: hypothetical protein ACK5IA_03075 [Cyanobacteriota bacterium]
MRNIFSFSVDDPAVVARSESVLVAPMPGGTREAVKQATAVQAGTFNLPAAAVVSLPTSSLLQQPLVQQPVVQKSLDQVGTSADPAVLAVAKAAAPGDTTDQAYLLAPTEMVSGMSQSELGEEWWQTMYSIPLKDHLGTFDDNSDPMGRRGSVEKAMAAQYNESVLFIGGAFGEITTGAGTDGTLRLQRTIVLPNDGKATVFFPILNSFFDNLVNDPGNPDNFTGNLDFQGLLDAQAEIMDPIEEGGWVSGTFASVDGEAVEDPLSYRQVSLDAFSYTAPYPASDGLLGPSGFTNETYLDNLDAEPIQLKKLAQGKSVTIGPAAADGYWLAVDVKGGDHDLRFGGNLINEDEELVFSLDVAYEIINPIYGTKEKDSITGFDSNDYLSAGKGDDLLVGGKGDDLLVGGNGKDVVDGGIGSDELWGDGGIDAFVFKKGYGKDTIFDFSQGERVEVPRGSSASVIDQMLPSGLTAAQVDFGGGDVLVFAGLRSSDLAFSPGLINFA